jgi:hypothetical protein
LSALRASNTTYTNNTGRPIAVLIQVRSISNGTAYISINGGTYTNIAGGYNAYGTQDYSGERIIPTGASYSVTVGGSLAGWWWWELR